MAFQCRRWTLANILPVAFVILIICTIWALYGYFHLLFLMQSEDARQRGISQAIISQTLTIVLLFCFVRAVLTDPGSVPDTSEWRGREVGMKLQFSLKGSPTTVTESPSELPQNFEVKQTGERRFCKWCDKYKPDRCHHCRVCRSCILRMDHHCPWIANCIGFRNHKFFFLLVLYALLNCLYITVTMWETVTRAVNDEMVTSQRFFIVFGMTLAVIMGMLLFLFFLIHIALMLKAQTTIEYCEKRHKKSGAQISFDNGFMGNVKAVLGPNPLLWLLPTSPPEGEGLVFEAHAESAEGGAAASSGDRRAMPLQEAPAPDSRHKHMGMVIEEEATDSDATTVADTSPPEVTGAKAAAA